jgi:hypothetical protein
MTRRERERDRNEEHRLSTADMAAAAENRPGREAREPLVQPPVDEMSQTDRAAADMRAGDDGRSVALLDENQLGELRNQWTDIQTGFVDEPRRSVEQADALVADVMRRLAEGFANERDNLERQWSGGGDVSTEDLRQALRRYRSFFDRLLSV